MQTELHVLPENDSRIHLHNRDCWCEPKLTESLKPTPHPVIIHRAQDGRQLLEREWNCLEITRL